MRTLTRIVGLVLFLMPTIGITSSLIGQIVPPYPQELKNVAGACISRALGTDKVCEFSVGVLNSFSGPALLYVGKSAPRIDPRKARWYVTDTMVYPDTPKGYQVVYANCEHHGQANDAIIAVAKVTDTKWFELVTSAYEVNLSTGKIEKISTTGIRCYNEGMGV